MLVKFGSAGLWDLVVLCVQGQGDARSRTAHLEVVGGHHSDVLGLHTSVHQGLDVHPHQLDFPWDRNRV